MNKLDAEGENESINDVFVGDQIHLNKYVPCSLFKASNGNKYIITNNHLIEEDDVQKIAIALVHRHLPPFTMQVLNQQPLEYGQWHGSYRIRLVNALNEECGMGFPGVISLGDRHASIQCRQLDGSVDMVSLGYVGQKGFHFQDFDGWLIEPTEFRETFFQKTFHWQLELGGSTKR